MDNLEDLDAIKRLIMGCLKPNRRLQRELINEYCTEDVVFDHFLGGHVEGRDNVYHIYRLAATSWDYKVDFHDFISSDDKLVVRLDLGVKVPPFYLFRYNFPTVVIMYFRRCSDGKLRICRQVDHHSLFVFFYALGWPSSALADYIWRPAAAHVFSLMGWLLDAAEEVREQVAHQASDWLRAAAGRTP